MSPNFKAAALMAASMASFTINDALMKSVSDDMSLFQAMFLRGMGGSVLILVAAAVTGSLRLRLPRRDRGLVVWRTLAEIAAAYCFITALFHMPIANATAIMQAMPLSVTLAAAAFLGEPIGWRRLLAILVGFAGVMLIVRPGAEGFTIYSIYVVGAVIFVTARDLTARMVSIETSSMTVAVAASLGVMAFGGVGLVFGPETWRPVPPDAWLALGGASLMITFAYMFSIATMRAGDIAFVAPFRYTSLLWALLLGWVVFGEWPDGMTMIGAGIVVATGIFTFHRERKLAEVAAREAARNHISRASVDKAGDSI
ncbi:DMT family transporter [Tropicimonas aquimaris]|uniref:DMT family transporter n=1 Tax=Tropicimonas aquimaris TaxID=914152 RepID=A0ABW3IU53_9RHOB